MGEGLAARPMSSEERKVAFFAKPVWQRALIVFAGPAINFVFALAILSGLYMSYGQPLTPPTASAIIKGSSADVAGFKPHDRVTAIDGMEVKRFEDIRQRVMIELDTPMKFTVDRNGETLVLTATPKRETFKDRFGFEHSRGTLGLIGAVSGFNVKNVIQVDNKKVGGPQEAIAALRKKLGKTTEVTFKGVEEGDKNSVLVIEPFTDLNANLGKTDSTEDQTIIIAEKIGDDMVKHPPLAAIGAAFTETKEVTLGTLTALGQIVTGTRSPKELGGLIRIGAMAGDMAQAGLMAVLTFTALLSINLGLINLFPIPVLDGGHLVFYTLEAIKGSPVPEKAQEYAFRVGFTILIGIMVFSNLSDILQLIL